VEKDLVETPRGPLTPADPAAIAAAETARARIQAQFLMALQKPRNEDQARARILKACKNPEFAAQVEYSKPIGNTSVKGLSIRAAEVALREWGNVMALPVILYEDDEQIRASVLALDLETNAAFGSEFTLRKIVERRSKKGREVIGERTNVHGDKIFVVRATDDEMRTRLNAQISMAIRNEGLRLIPADIKIEMQAQARKTLGDTFAKDPDQEKKKLVDGFATIGIYPRDLEAYLKHSLDIVSPKEMEDLRQMFVAVRDGEAAWADYLEAEEVEPTAPIGEDEEDHEEARAVVEKFWGTTAKTLEDEGYNVIDIRLFVDQTSEEYGLLPWKVMKTALDDPAKFSDEVRRRFKKAEKPPEPPVEPPAEEPGKLPAVTTPPEIVFPSEEELLRRLANAKKTGCLKFAEEFAEHLQSGLFGLTRPRAFAKFYTKYESLVGEAYEMKPKEKVEEPPVEPPVEPPPVEPPAEKTPEDEASDQTFTSQIAFFEELLGEDSVARILASYSVDKPLDLFPSQRERMLERLNDLAADKEA
jgi:hypothetical protein